MLDVFEKRFGLDNEYQLRNIEDSILQAYLICVELDWTGGNASLNGGETAGKALRMSSKAWEPCSATNLDAPFIYLFGHLRFQIMLTVIAVCEVTCERRDSTHGLS